MKPLKWLVILLSVGIAGAAIMLANYKPPAVGNKPNMAVDGVRHPVSAEMMQDAKERRGQKVPDFNLGTADGKKISLSSLLKKAPTVVVMTKDGCPCSIESQPYFNQLAESYQGKVNFVALLDADRNIGDLYALSLKVPYPIACDPQKGTFKGFQAKQSVYVYLLNQDQTIKHVWPGYSASMLKEMNIALADAAGVQPGELDVEGAPEKLSSGCFFFE